MPHDISREERPVTGLPEQTARAVPAGVATSSYQSTLLNIIEAATTDPARLRRVIYDLARMNLKREIRLSSPLLTPAKARECLLALETAIKRVEGDLSRGELVGGLFPKLSDSPPQPEPPAVATESVHALPAPLSAPNYPTDRVLPARMSRSELEEETSGSPPIPLRTRERQGGQRAQVASLSKFEPLGRTDRPQVEIIYPESDHPETVRLRRRAWRWLMIWPMAQFAGAILLSVVLYVALTGKLHDAEPPAAAGGEASRAASSGLPLPTSYGVYAVSHGHLSELETFPIRAPDPRISLSAEINEPSKTTLPDGNIVFIAFQRDLVNSAPRKAAIRVVARVTRAVTFNAGKVANTNLQGSWRIRSNSYEFSVAPLSESREMVTIRPESVDFALPAGRYALVFNGLAYDFTIDGPVTDRAQCLESVATLNGAVYTDCGQN